MGASALCFFSHTPPSPSTILSVCVHNKWRPQYRKQDSIPHCSQLPEQKPAAWRMCSFPRLPSRTAPGSCGARCAGAPLSLRSLDRVPWVPRRMLLGWDIQRSCLLCLPAHSLCLGILRVPIRHQVRGATRGTLVHIYLEHCQGIVMECDEVNRLEGSKTCIFTIFRDRRICCLLM